MAISVFERYPQLNSLKGLVPEDVVEDEIGSWADELDAEIERAKKSIPTINLNRIFPAELEKSPIRLENFLGHWGNVSIEELCKICLIVSYFKPKRILEIGTYNGMTTLQMTLNAPEDCVTYTLDLPLELMQDIKLSQIDSYVAKHIKGKFNTSTGCYFEGRNDVKIKQLWGDSSVFDYDSLNEKFDIIFIDAAHDYKNIKIDTENAFRLLSDNGVILWHDYTSPANVDVTKYLADISSLYKIFNLRNTMLGVYWKGFKQ